MGLSTVENNHDKSQIQNNAGDTYTDNKMDIRNWLAMRKLHGIGEYGVNGPRGKWSGAKVLLLACWFAALLDLIFRLTFALVLHLLFTNNSST